MFSFVFSFRFSKRRNDEYVSELFMCGSRWGTGGPDPPENSQKYRVFSNTDPDPIKKHKFTKPAFNVRSTSACQRNAI